MLNLPDKDRPPIPTTYCSALACIAEPDTKALAEAIVLTATEIARATAEGVARQLLGPAEWLRMLAIRSPDVLATLIAIVEAWNVNPPCLAAYCLAAQVVGSLLVEGYLDRTQTARTVRGFVASWCDIVEQGMFWGTDGDEVGAIADKLIDEMGAPLAHVTRAMPELMVYACFCRLNRSPDSDVYSLCEAMRMSEVELELSGLMLPAKTCDEGEILEAEVVS